MSEVLIEKVNKTKDQKKGTVMYRLKDTHTEMAYDHLTGKFTEREAYPSQYSIAREYQIVKNGELILKRFIKGKRVDPNTGNVIPIEGTITFLKEQGGVITCDLSTPNGLAMDEFLSEHPNNESSPYFNSYTHKAIFYKVDSAKEAQVKLNETKGLKDAMVKAFELDLNGLKMFARLVGTQDVYKKGEAELRVIAVEHASKDPENFFKILDDKEGLMKVNIEEAEEKGLIKFDNATKIWSWENGTAIKSLASNKAKLEGLVEYFTTNAGSTQYVIMCEKLENLKTK